MIRRLLYMNGLAILGTVFNHAHGWGLIAMFLWTHRYSAEAIPYYAQASNPAYYFLRLIEQIVVIAIPTFLFVSGFFIAFATGSKQSTVSWKIVFARIKYLVIPYIFWCIVAICGDLLEGKTQTILEYVRLILTGTIRGPYYFVPLLIQFYLLSPLLVLWAKSKWKLFLLLVGLIQVGVLLTYYLFLFHIEVPPLPKGFVLPSWLFLTRIFWFPFGIVVGLNLSVFKQWFLKVRWPMLVLTGLFFVIGLIEMEIIFNNTEGYWIPIETMIDSIYALFFIITILGFEQIAMPATKSVEYLGSNTFGIYLAHVPAQEYPARLIYLLVPGLLANQYIFITLLFITGLFIPLILMNIMRRQPFERYYRYVFG